LENIFSHSVRCLFTLLIVTFTVFFPLGNLLYLFLLLCFISQNCLHQYLEVSLCSFHSFSSYTEIFDPFWVDFCLGWGPGSSFNLLHMDIQSSHYHLLKRLPFSQCTVLVTLSRISWLKMCGFIPGISILFQWCMCVFMPVSCCFVYYGSIVCLEMRFCDASSFVLFVQDCFGYSRSFVFPYEL
jgi:hypothetical protein